MHGSYYDQLTKERPVCLVRNDLARYVVSEGGVACYDRDDSTIVFFSEEVPQFGSLRPLTKTDFQEKKNCCRMKKPILV